MVNFLNIRLSIIKSNLLVWSGIFVDILVPAESVSGEALRVYLIAREQGNDTCGRVVASLVTHRILGMTMNVIVLITSAYGDFWSLGPRKNKANFYQKTED